MLIPVAKRIHMAIVVVKAESAENMIGKSKYRFSKHLFVKTIFPAAVPTYRSEMASMGGRLND